MRASVLLIALLAAALVTAGCGGPDEAERRLAQACERQLQEVGEQEASTPTAKSTNERLEERTLIECAGQQVKVVAADEDSEDVDKAATDDGTDPAQAEDPGSGGDEAAPPELDDDSRQLFAQTCGSCHVLEDAGTTGTVGPNLDETTLDAVGVAQKIEEGGGGMPPNLLEGEEREDVAEYVARAAAQR